MVDQEKKPCWVGFDTSNYTTSAAVTTIDEQGHLTVVANHKLPLPVATGARGLRQSDAVFAHVKNLPAITERLRETLTEGNYRVAAVGYSATPRDAEGSYMPCFLTGEVAANAFAAGANVDVYAFSHQSGHIMAALYSSGYLMKNSLSDKPFMAFHVSGGTTEAVVAHPRSDGFDVTLIGGGADLHAGQVIDRIGVLMGLDFPCGKAMEDLAAAYLADHRITDLRPCVRDGMCHLSGLENQAAKRWQETGDRGEVSAFVLTFIGKTLRLLTDQLQEKVQTAYGLLPVVYAGGVMSNRLIRPLLSNGARWETYFAEPAFSADNAAGTSLLCALRAQ